MAGSDVTLTDIRDRLLKGTGYITIVNGLIMVFRVLLVYLLAFLLDLRSYGLFWSALAPAIVITGIFDFRFGEAITKFGTEYLTNGKRDKALTVVWLGYGVGLLISCVVGAALFFGAGFIACSVMRRPELTFLIKLSALAPIFGSPQSASTAMLRIFNRFLPIGVAQTTRAFLRFLLPIALATRGLTAVMLGYVAADLIASIVTICFTVSTYRTEFKGTPLSRLKGEFRRIVAFSTQNFIGITFKALARGEILIIIVTRYESPVEVGYVKAALGIAGLLALVPSAAVFVAYGTLSELWAKKDVDTFLHIIKRMALGLGIGTAFCGIALAAVAPFAIEHFWRPSFVPAVALLYWLVAAQIVDMSACWLRASSLAMGKPVISTIVNFIRMTLLITVSIITVPLMGFQGVGVATLIFATVSVEAGIWMVARELKKANATQT